MSMRFRLVLIFVIFSFVFGCGGSDQTPKKAQVVRRKIVSAPSTAATTPQGSKTKNNNKAVSDPATMLLDLKDEAVAYHYQGALDPFLPLIKDADKDASKEVPVKKKKKRRVPKTALEKIDLTQLTLTAIFKGRKQFKGLVEEPTGKGYIVSNGTHIGLDGGKITSILKDRLLITEVSEDMMGKSVTVKRELKLRQSSGE